MHDTFFFFYIHVCLANVSMLHIPSMIKIPSTYLWVFAQKSLR